MPRNIRGFIHCCKSAAWRATNFSSPSLARLFAVFIGGAREVPRPVARGSGRGGTPCRPGRAQRGGGGSRQERAEAHLRASSRGFSAEVETPRCPPAATARRPWWKPSRPRAAGSTEHPASARSSGNPVGIRRRAVLGSAFDEGDFRVGQAVEFIDQPVDLPVEHLALSPPKLALHSVIARRFRLFRLQHLIY